MSEPRSHAHESTVTAPVSQACDAHIHIYEPGVPAQGPFPPRADAAAYLRLRARLGTTRTVVVQPRVYGTDNSVTLRAIQALGADHTRGIAVVSPDIDEAALVRLHEGGIRGVRLSLYTPNAKAGGFDTVERLARKVAPMGWHLQLHWTADQIAEHQALLHRLPLPIVFDHLARLPMARPLSHPAFQVVRGLLAAERAWVKLSGPYLDSKVGSEGAYLDTDPVARAWLETAPHRAVWGSDWPHVTERAPPPDTVKLFDLLARWCDDNTLRQRVLVENPAQLYGFPPPLPWRTKMKPTRFAVSGIASALFACLAAPALAADYPTQSITMVVPYSAGGGADNAARIIAQGMEAVTGQTVVIENRPGASGSIGASAVARSKPDGYTVLYDASSFAINAVLRKLPYDPDTDFIPVTQAVVVPNILVVANDSPYQTLADYIAAAKANPGGHDYASYGPGSLAQMAAELLKKEADIDLVHIPYKGGAPAMVDVMGGHVEAYFANAASGLNYVTQGKLRALAVTSDVRMDEIKDVPTMMEAGIKDFTVYEWNGFFFPKGTPSEAVERLYEVVKETLENPEVRERLTGLGLEPVASSPAEFSAFLKEEQQRWADVAKANDITVD